MPVDTEQWKGKVVEQAGSGADWFWMKFTDGSEIKIDGGKANLIIEKKVTS